MISKYPKFHKYVTRGYALLIWLLGMILPICYAFKNRPKPTSIIIILIFVSLTYLIYWLVVRLNCYGVPIQNRQNDPSLMLARTTNSSLPNNNNNNDDNNDNNNDNSSNAIMYQTFANYRLNGLAERMRIFGSDNDNNNGRGDMEEALRPPPPTYNKALEGIGLPPPYLSKIEENEEEERENEDGRSRLTVVMVEQEEGTSLSSRNQQSENESDHCRQDVEIIVTNQSSIMPSTIRPKSSPSLPLSSSSNQTSPSDNDNNEVHLPPKPKRPVSSPPISKSHS